MSSKLPRSVGVITCDRHLTHGHQDRSGRDEKPDWASAALLMQARHGNVILLANVALALEYEATCCRAEHVMAAGLTAQEVGIFVDAVIAMAEPVESHFMWRPLVARPGR